MIGNFALYDKSFAETSKTGWYETYKSAPKGWIILECYPDGSCDKHTFENSESIALATVNMLNDRQGNELPYYIDHGVKYYHQVI